MIWTRDARVVRTVGLASIALLAVGCTNAIDGKPGTAEGASAATTSTYPSVAAVAPPTVDEFRWLTSVLPTSTDLSRALNRRITPHRPPPPVQDRNGLRDTVAGSHVSETHCVGVISPLEKEAFGTAPVKAVAFGMESAVTFGTVAIESAQEAHVLFDKFVKQWHQCNGTAVLKSDGTQTYRNEVTHVSATDAVVSAVVVMSTTPDNTALPAGRALGVAKDVIVDVEVPVDKPQADTPGPATAAANLAQLMLTKVGAVRP